MKKIIVSISVATVMLLVNTTNANTTASSTMWFYGGLTPYDVEEGIYTGTIDAIAGYYYASGGPGYSSYNGPTPPSGKTQGGFDVYAKDGAEYYIKGGSSETGTISDHDYATADTPDVPNYWDYHLELTETSWRVWGFVDNADHTAYSGPMDWANMIAYETGANWNPHWTGGEENVPLEVGAFKVDITFGSIPATVSLTPIPAPGAILLGGIGVCLVGWLRRRRALKSEGDL